MAKKKKVVKKIKLTIMAAKYWRILINSPDKYYNAPMLPMPNIVIHRQPKMDVTKPLEDGERYPLAQVDTRWVEDSTFGLFDPYTIVLHIYPKMFIRYFHHYYGGMHLPYEAAAVYVTKVLIHEFCHHIRNMHMWKQCVPIPKKDLIRDFKKSCEKMSLYLDKAGTWEDEVVTDAMAIEIVRRFFQISPSLVNDEENIAYYNWITPKFDGKYNKHMIRKAKTEDEKRNEIKWAHINAMIEDLQIEHWCKFHADRMSDKEYDKHYQRHLKIIAYLKKEYEKNPVKIILTK